MNILKFCLFLIIIFSLGVNACFTPIDDAILSKSKMFFEKSDIVLLGEVKKISKSDAGFIDIPAAKAKTKSIPVTKETVFIRVSEFLKGAVTDWVEVENINGFGCSYQYQIGKKYLVFATDSKKNNEIYKSIGALAIEDDDAMVKILELFSTFKQ